MSALQKDPLNLIIAGVGGQGNILASQVIALSALLEDIHTTIGETYGVSQRGGSVMSHIRLTRGQSPGPLIPYGETHVLIGFEPLETLKVAMAYANRETLVFCNPRPAYPIGVLAGDMVYPETDKILNILRDHVASLMVLNATEMAKKAGEIRCMNLVMVGVLVASGLLPVKKESFDSTLLDLFKGRSLETNHTNILP